jgi:hypothetical protein
MGGSIPERVFFMMVFKKVFMNHSISHVTQELPRMKWRMCHAVPCLFVLDLWCKGQARQLEELPWLR